jgi:hypothetical protein
LPTYENIIATFGHLAEVAQPNDQIYIHYSVGGGRSSTIYPELKGQNGKDSGIVPMDIGIAEGNFLRDVEFVTLLKRLTDKGLAVTVTLDSCHAGGMTHTIQSDYSFGSPPSDLPIAHRSHRGAGEIDSLTRSTDSLVAPREQLLSNWSRLANEPNFNPYILLAACRPHEYSYEYRVNSEAERGGALTYWFLDTLHTLGLNISYCQLYNRIFAKIHSIFPQQTPLLYGDGSRIVFRRDRLLSDAAVTVMKATDQQITLNAGLAQGLSKGTQFAIYPLNFTTFSNKQKQLAVAEVTGVNASTALARVLTPEAGGIDARGTIEQGASAVMISAPVDLVRRVRLFDQKQAGETEHDLPPALVDRQKAALDAVRQALAGNGWVVEAQTETQEAYYQVAIGRTGNYEICIGLPIENLLPSLPIDDPDSAAQVVKRLVHLAKYQAVQELDNVNSKLTDALEIELLDKNKQPFPDANNLVITQGEVVYLRIKNAFDKVLNVVVLDLEPTWEISHIPLHGIDTIFYQLEPHETIDTSLRFEVPKGEWYESCRETLKLFAAHDPIDFRWLELPPIADLPRGRSGERQAANRQSSTMQQGALFEQSRITHRAASISVDPVQEWAVKQISILIQRF